MSGRLMLNMHPDALMVDDPTCDALGAALVQIGTEAGALVATGKNGRTGSTSRTHKLVRKRGKLLRVQLTKEERWHNGDWDGDGAVEAILATEPNGLSGRDICIRMGWKRANGGFYRLINRMILAGKVEKRQFNTHLLHSSRFVKFYLVRPNADQQG